LFTSTPWMEAKLEESYFENGVCCSGNCCKPLKLRAYPVSIRRATFTTMRTRILVAFFYRTRHAKRTNLSARQTRCGADLVAVCKLAASFLRPEVNRPLTRIQARYLARARISGTAFWR
jgi:hypothetical protein